ncbi:hypothetical protein BGZ96_012183, partial [Linnemannia gamsii]
MKETQSFRLIGTTEVIKIPVQQVDGQNVVYWESIEQVFPGVKCVKNDNVAIPRYIKYFPGVVLDIASSTAYERLHVDSSAEPSSPALIDALTSALTFGRIASPAGLPSDPSNAEVFVEGLRVASALEETPASDVGLLDTPSNLSPATSVASKATSFQKIVTLASRKARDSEVEQRFISLLAPEVQKTVRASSDIYQAFTKVIKDGNGGLSRADLRQELGAPFQKLEAILVAKNTELQEEMSAMRKEMNAKQEDMNAKQEEMMKLQEASSAKQEEIIRLQEEMKQMQQRALDQLFVLQSRVQAVLTQTYELHEYPIPRLFIVLPQYPSGWDILKPFTDKYRLYFLCECGEHTKAAGSNNKIPHEIHLAKHEGYEIARPTDFFRQYGPYVLTILKMLKYGVSVASVAVPAVAHLINADALDQAAKGLQHLKECIEPGMDHVISKIEKDSVDEGEPIENFADGMENKEALEGADLRNLETFLKDKDGSRVLGNLYRTVTDKGHVKWVCMDHYRENYNRTAAEEFRRAVDSVGGSFDENNGQVKVMIRSRATAEQFYSALGKARSVHELDLCLALEGSKSDLEALEAALKRSSVSLLRLDLQHYRPSFGSKASSTSARYGALVRIVGHPNTKMIHIVLPKDLVKLSDFPTKTPPHLHKLSFSMVPESSGVKGLRLLLATLKTNLSVTTLDLVNNSIGDDGAKALSEALRTNSNLTTLNLMSNSIGDDGAKALAEALKTNSTLTTLDLQHNSIGDDGAKALSEALRTNSTLTTLNLESNSIWFKGVLALSEVLSSKSTLTTINIDEGAMAMFEALKTNSTLTTLD